MTKKAIFDRFSWNWNYAETPQNVEAHYSKSELVREFLVLHAFSGSRLSQVDRLEHAVAIAFDKVCRGIKQGLIELDYVPCESDRMNIPAIEHPHHMQALLYWCAQLDARCMFWWMPIRPWAAPPALRVSARRSGSSGGKGRPAPGRHATLACSSVTRRAPGTSLPTPVRWCANDSRPELLSRDRGLGHQAATPVRHAQKAVPAFWQLRPSDVS